jgi:hypothetical protein
MFGSVYNDVPELMFVPGTRGGSREFANLFLNLFDGGEERRAKD